MPRKPRFFLPGVTVHVVQRGHSREAVFYEDDDYLAYLRWLGEGAERYNVDIHAYVLMTNHIHILATAHAKDGITRMMQYIGRHYVPYINHTYGTSGSIREGRYKASLIHDEEYLLICMRYIELNPTRANMVRSPGQYRWSSYRRNGQGKEDKLVTPHAMYQSLGTTDPVRIAAYKKLFQAHLEIDALEEIRAAWQTGTPLGSDGFRQQIEAKLKLKVGQARRGRPSKPKVKEVLA
jgi:putative transposase